MRFNAVLIAALFALACGHARSEEPARDDSGRALPPAEASGAAKEAAELIKRGEWRQQQGDVDGALLDFDHAIRLDPKNPLPYLDRGLALEAKGDPVGALQAYDEAIVFDPKYSPAWCNRANLRREKGDIDGALRDYDRALLLQPRDATTLANRGSTRCMKRDWDGAISDASLAIEVNPRDALAWEVRGFARGYTGDLDAALQDLDTAIELNKAAPSAFASRADLRSRKGDFDGALADAEASVVLDPRNFWAFHQRARAQAGKGRVEAAVKDFETAIRLNPRYAAAYTDLSDLYRLHDQPAEALAVLGRGIVQFPNEPAIYYWRASLKFDQAQFQDALDDELKSIEVSSPRSSGDYSSLFGMVCHLRLAPPGERPPGLDTPFKDRDGRTPGDWPASVAAFLRGELAEEELFKLTDSSAERRPHGHACEAWFYAGEVLLAKGDGAAAKEHFEKCVATGVTTFTEYRHAQAELKRMKDAK